MDGDGAVVYGKMEVKIILSATSMAKLSLLYKLLDNDNYAVVFTDLVNIIMEGATLKELYAIAKRRLDSTDTTDDNENDALVSAAIWLVGGEDERQ